MITAIFIPSLNRPHRIRDTVANIQATTPEPHKIYYMVSDDESIEILKELGIDYFTDKGGDTRYVTRMNYMYANTTEPFMFTGSDDVLFHPGWLSTALAMMGDKLSVIVPNDLFNQNGTEALIRRSYVDEQSCCMDTPGVLFYPEYRHNYADNEQFDTAKKRGVHGYCAESVVEHLHWAAGKNVRDETYAQADAGSSADAELFNSRRYLFQ